MHYDLSRFTPQSFERFVQALAVAVAGSGVQVFGAGRDGAREATFEGATSITERPWNGYTVFQAKHRQYPQGPPKDADWLIGEMESELNKFSDPKRNLRKPDFYVLASNVRLSASAASAIGKGEGGIDKVMRHLRSKSEAVGIKDVHLWHADTLCSLLDVHIGVRQTYDFWIQPGDVLASILRALDGPGQEEVLVPYLRRSFRLAREIKTKDIGQTIGRTVNLEEVFVDLPIKQIMRNISVGDINKSNHSDPTSGIERLIVSEETQFSDEGEELFGRDMIAAELMHRAAQKFELQNNILSIDDRSSRYRQRSLLPNRIVLMGGPGQGKSTVGQFFAQICRARLLHTLSSTQADETNIAIKAVLACAEVEKIPLIGPPRYPFHIELPRYADALSVADREGRSLSLLAHVAQDISKNADRSVTASTLRQWLGTLPAAIILDGLDEVPRSGNRQAVIKAIEDLLDTVHDANCDCLIFCTSRPQGYEQELNPKLWAHWLLQPLESETALRLAERVSSVLVAEESRRDEILSALNEATEDDTTAPLMTSPLQIMLLFQLASTYNNIPKDRWTLFQRHYETLRDREIAKGGTIGTTIGRYRSQIDSVHHDAGYLLHLRAEDAGGAGAYFSDEEFENLVTKRLIQDGFDIEAKTIAPIITNLATNRLVLLRSQIAGQVAFDVRSLQEFMAAARLTTGPESLIRDRLKAITGRSHWLHVFKIACSKIYGSSAHEALRDHVIGLLDSLDNGDRCLDDRLLRTGANLALNLLVDGTARGLPIYRRQLVVRALRIITGREYSPYAALVDAIDFRERNHLEPIILDLLICADPSARIEILRMLACAATHSPADAAEWTIGILIAQWPEKPDQVLDLFDSPILLPADENLVSRLCTAQWRSSPFDVVKWTFDLTDEVEESSCHQSLILFGKIPEIQWIKLATVDGRTTNLRIRYRPLANAMRVANPTDEFAHPAWRAMAAASDFSDDPSIQRAVEFLETARNNSVDRAKVETLPWPLSGLLVHAARSGSHEATIAALRSGALGDVDLWRAAEDRWRTSDVHPTDLISVYRSCGMELDWTKGGSALVEGFDVYDEGEIATDTLLYLASALPTEIWPYRLLFSYAARDPNNINKSFVEFLELFDPNTLPENTFFIPLYISALVNAVIINSSSILFDRLVHAFARFYQPVGDLNIIADRLIGAYCKDENRRFLLPAIFDALRDGSHEMMPKLPESAFTFLSGDASQITSAVAMLRVLFGRDDATEPQAILAIQTSPHIMLVRFIRKLVRGEYGSMGVDVALTICRGRLTDPANEFTQIFRIFLSMIAEARPVPLSDPQCFGHLELPPPLPASSQLTETK